MVATAGGVLPRRRSPGGARRRGRLVRRLRASRAMRRSRRSRRRSRCRSGRWRSAIRLAVIIFSCVSAAAVVFLHRANLRSACAWAPRAASAAPPPRGAVSSRWPHPDFSDSSPLACHDLRTPLATVNGFAKTLVRGGGARRASTRFVGLIDAGRRADGRPDRPARARRADRGRTLRAGLARGGHARARRDRPTSGSRAGGSGETIQHRRARRCGGRLDRARGRGAPPRRGPPRRVDGRRPRAVADAGPRRGGRGSITGEETKDLGALVARMAIEAAWRLAGARGRDAARPALDDRGHQT